ncbi:MAG: nitrate reductase associated protein [Candidatus Binataceae bacterium]
MIRHFKFEHDIYETLDLVPMAVRRKLDHIGIKVGLEQWRMLSRGERLAICHLPVNLEEECEALRVFVREAVKRLTGAEPKTIPAAERTLADPPAEPPSLLVEHAREAGFVLDENAWNKLDADARYALVKMGARAKISPNFSEALNEFLSAHVDAAPSPEVKS